MMVGSSEAPSRQLEALIGRLMSQQSRPAAMPTDCQFLPGKGQFGWGI
jgi:hypothetical protein